MTSSNLLVEELPEAAVLSRMIWDKKEGQPLSPMIRMRMETFFNTSFEDIRIHIGQEASSIGAMAFTCGTDLYFAPGKYNPYTPEGLRLLAHELAHVIQQREGRVKNPNGNGIFILHDERLEAEAEWLGVQASLFQFNHLKSKPYNKFIDVTSAETTNGVVIQCKVKK